MKNLKRLSRAELKKVRGTGSPCIQEFDSGCSLSNDPGLLCCSGLKCELNATNSGTICVKA